MRELYNRRAILRVMAGAVSGATMMRASLAGENAVPENGGTQAGWSFDGVTGPAHWSELSPEYSHCQFGIEQSPVDLVDALKVTSTEALKLDYQPVMAQAARLSWAFQLTFDPGCKIIINGRHFALEHMLFRRPSEHLLSGRALEMELQLMHRSESGARAIVAVFIRQGKKNKIIDMMLGKLAGEEKPDEGNKAGEETVFPLNPLDLLPPKLSSEKGRSFYRYMGSLTTPPCEEGVIWTIFKTPLEVSPKQLRELATLFPANARPASKINRRYLLEHGG